MAFQPERRGQKKPERGRPRESGTLSRGSNDDDMSEPLETNEQFNAEFSSMPDNVAVSGESARRPTLQSFPSLSQLTLGQITPRYARHSLGTIPGIADYSLTPAFGDAFTPRQFSFGQSTRDLGVTEEPSRDTRKRQRSLTTSLPQRRVDSLQLDFSEDNATISTGAKRKRVNLPSKKGSIISPEDRNPASAREIAFCEEAVPILHSLVMNNMQHLSFFPRERWMPAYRDAVAASAPLEDFAAQTTETGAVPQRLDSFGSSASAFLNIVKDENFVVEPSDIGGPLLTLSYTGRNQPPATGRSRLRMLSRESIARTASQGRHSTMSGLLNQIGNTVSFSNILNPLLPEDLRKDISNLTSFQTTLARYKCREVLGFFKLLLSNKDTPKLACAQTMEASSRFVVRTILNWGREYIQNGGHFNRSKIGKHQRVTLYSDPEFREALLKFAEEKGDSISVDSASEFIREFHRKRKEEDPSSDIPSPPSSRATVHRWLKLLNIRLGPRGKKKGGGRTKRERN